MCEKWAWLYCGVITRSVGWWEGGGRGRRGRGEGRDRDLLKRGEGKEARGKGKRDRSGEGRERKRNIGERILVKDFIVSRSCGWENREKGFYGEVGEVAAKLIGSRRDCRRGTAGRRRVRWPRRGEVTGGRRMEKVETKEDIAELLKRQWVNKEYSVWGFILSCTNWKLIHQEVR